MFIDWKIQQIIMLIILKLVYRFNAIAIKIQKEFFVHLDKIISQLTCEFK
jgi:hypothetical protein